MTQSLLAALFALYVGQLILQLPPSPLLRSDVGVVTVSVKEATSKWLNFTPPSLYVEIEHNGLLYSTRAVPECMQAHFNSTFAFEAGFCDSFIVRVRDAAANAILGKILLSASETKLGHEQIYKFDKHTRALIQVNWVKGRLNETSQQQ